MIAASVAFGQPCPSARGPKWESEIRTLEGRLVFHDALRKWFELKLDQTQCGQNSIQLVQPERTGTSMEVFRGCRVRSLGPLDFSRTGYFSLDLYQEVSSVESVGNCERQQPFPDYSKARPGTAVREYRVEMHVIYEPGDHPIVFSVTSAGKELHPWQAYAGSWLTGSFILYARCGEGFVVDEVFGTPEAHPGHFDPQSSDDTAAFDPESAADAGKRDLRLGYTCVRSH